MTALLLLVGEAQATLINVSLCGELRVGYTDVSSNNSRLEDDHFPDNANQPARGAILRVVDDTASTTTDYVLSDADPACALVQLDTNHSYDLRLLAKAQLNGNTIRVWNNDTDDNLWAHADLTNWQPPINLASYTVVSGSHDAWNILAAASWALHRENAGLSGETLTFYTQTCPGAPSGISCYNSTNGRVYIDPIADQLKYVVTHEMGHNAARLRDSGLIPDKPVLSTPDGDCQADDGPMIQKRYVAWAADEGLAWYYAAVAFNDSTDTDCDFYRTGHDWNQNGTPGEDMGGANDEVTPSCEGTTTEGWASEDYLGNECGGTLEDRGTYIDWMRAFWDADQDGLTTEDIFDLWVEADPSTWNGDGACDTADTGLQCADDPQERLEDAADSLGILSVWSSAASDNGVR